LNLGGSTVYSTFDTFARVRTDAPLVPGEVEVVNGLGNSQHSRAETFWADVTIAVAMSCLGVAAREIGLKARRIAKGRRVNMMTLVVDVMFNSGTAALEF